MTIQGDFFGACIRGNLERVKECVSMGADIRVQIHSAVGWGSMNGHLEVVKYLVSLGADIRADNDSALIGASCNGHLKVVKYLVSCGADFRNEDAIRWANLGGHYEIVKYFVSLGAPIELISERMKAYIAFCEKMEKKRQEQAQKKIYFWWIPICYDINRECGKRMRQKNYEKYLEIY